MRCPECGIGIMEPQYLMLPTMMLDGRPEKQPMRRRLLRLQCPHCGNYVLAQDGESPEAVCQRMASAQQEQ